MDPTFRLTDFFSSVVTSYQVINVMHSPVVHTIVLINELIHVARLIVVCHPTDKSPILQ